MSSPLESPSPPLPSLQATIVDRIQCRAQQCSRITRRGGYCTEHARELFGLEVKTSTLGEPGDSGLGLFTTRNRVQGEKIDEYKGDVEPVVAFLEHPSGFAVAISRGRVINATRSSHSFARFANDSRDDAMNNCWLVSDRQYGLHWASPRYTDGSGARVWLIASRDVREGEELFVSYGAEYWKSRQ